MCVCRLVSPAPPHDTLKNRYIFIDPRGASGKNPSSHHVRVRVDSSLVNGQADNRPWWAAQPDAACISVVTTTKPVVEPDWAGCDTAHVAGCRIIQTTTHAFAAESSGSSSAARTQADPSFDKPPVR